MNCSGDISHYEDGSDYEDNATFLNQLSDDELIYWNSMLEGSRYTVQRILFPIVMIIGVIGNSITMAVLTRRYMKSSTNLYLTALAVSDLLYLTFAFSLSLKHIPGMDHSTHWFYWHYYRYALWLTDASSNTSTWLTVTFTIERYIAVCHPIKGKVFCTQSRAKRVIVSVFLFCFLMTITTPHEWIVVHTQNANGTQLSHANSCLWKNDTFKKVYSWVSAVVFFFLPLMLLAVFNVFLVLAVKESRKQRHSLTGNLVKETQASQEYKITVMLIAVVLMAILCLMPTAIMIIYMSFHEIRPKTADYYTTLMLNNFFNFLTAVNATANFIFYCVLSDRYRRTFLKTFCRKWYEQSSPQLSWAGLTAYSNFEEGSPYSFHRGSSRISRRRSSYRSSTSSSPRHSPSRASFRAMERHSSKGDAFLMVPTFGSTKRKERQTFDSPNHNIRSHCFDPRGGPESRPLACGVDPKDLLLEEQEPIEESNAFVVKCPTAEVAKPRNDSEASLPPINRRKTLHLRRFFALLRAKQKNRSSTSRSRGQSIVITCQKPSFEEQTSV